MVNIIKNKKTKVIESPKQVQVPRQELPPVAESSLTTMLPITSQGRSAEQFKAEQKAKNAIATTPEVPKSEFSPQILGAKGSLLGTFENNIPLETRINIGNAVAGIGAVGAVALTAGTILPATTAGTAVLTNAGKVKTLLKTVGLGSIGLGTAITKVTAGKRQEVTNANEVFTGSKSNIDFISNNIDSIPTTEAMDMFEKEMQNIKSAQSALKQLTNNDLNSFLSGGADELASIETYLRLESIYRKMFNDKIKNKIEIQRINNMGENEAISRFQKQARLNPSGAGKNTLTTSQGTITS